MRTRSSQDASEYLAADAIVDHDDPSIVALARELRADDVEETARRCFEFVRDSIEHSVDFRRSPTTLRASDVLRSRTGFCYAKSHLLVALLRANGIAAGFCYQRLTFDGPTPPHCLHGFVAVELPGRGDYAIDARGNRADVDAAFVPPREQLAFPIQHVGEADFPWIYPRPLAVVADCLRVHDTWQAVVDHLPDAESLSVDARLTERRR